MKNMSHRYDVNRPWSRRKHKYIKYKMSVRKEGKILFNKILQWMSSIYKKV